MQLIVVKPDETSADEEKHLPNNRDGLHPSLGYIALSGLSALQHRFNCVFEKTSLVRPQTPSPEGAVYINDGCNPSWSNQMKPARTENIYPTIAMGCTHRLVTPPFQGLVYYCSYLPLFLKKH